jgi:hypothetical protein
MLPSRADNLKRKCPAKIDARHCPSQNIGDMQIQKAQRDGDPRRRSITSIKLEAR